MKFLPRSNCKVFNDESNPLNILAIPSTVIRYNQFITSQTNTNLWTPTSGKSIYITAIQIYAAVTATIKLQRASNAVFAIVSLTTSITSYNANYFSPIKFNTGESISLTSTNLGEIDITLFGFEM